MEKQCEHLNFHAIVNVGRLTEGDNGRVKNYMADVKVHCQDCGQPFEFIGTKHGVSFSEPTISIDAEELRAPIRPAQHPTMWFPVMKNGGQ